MNSLEELLLEECRSIAALVLHNYDDAELIKDIWTTDDRERLAQDYYECTQQGLAYINVSDDGDPEIVLRAVSYLGASAIPPYGESAEWFRHGLDALLVLARPFEGTPQEGQPFFADVREGMLMAEKRGMTIHRPL